MILSYFVAKSGVTAIHPGQVDETTGKNLVVQGLNLLSKEQLQLFLTSIVTNFTSFAPLGLLLVTILGAGLAEKSGYMETVMKTTVTKVPKKLLTGTIIFVGIIANAVVDAGFSANLMVSMLDILIAGLTIPAAQIVNSNYTGTPAMNWYFLIISTFILVVLGTFVTEKYLAPRFEGTDFVAADNDVDSEITPL